MEASLATDGIPGYVRTDIERRMLRIPATRDGTVVALEGDWVVGYVTPDIDDLTVHPGHRRRGHGRRLVTAGLALQRDRGRDALELHVPTNLPASAAFATRMGFRYRSSLWQFRLAPGVPVARPAFGDDLVLRPWDPATDTDFEAWTAFLHAAFDGHPTPMRWTPELIRHVHTAPGFEPTDVALLFRAGEPGQPIGFVRIARSPDDETDGERGEISLVGVLPAWRRRGLGRELLRWGIGALRDRGAGWIDLSVEAENDGATALYRAHGFEPAIEWPHWVLRTG